MLKQLKEKRRKLQSYTWLGLPIVIIGGWFYPKLGFFLLTCMIGALTIALYKGRAWCDWMCPRGSFYDLILQKFSLNKEIPAFFRKKAGRLLVMGILLSVLGVQIYFAWGDIDGIGLAMVRVLTVTTTAGILLGIIYQQRIWCHICPMGTLSNYLAEGKKPLTIAEHCGATCKLCSKVCPMQLKPYEYKDDGVMGDNDCIKCSTCVAACPKKALQFEKELKKAA